MIALVAACSRDQAAAPSGFEHEFLLFGKLFRRFETVARDLPVFRPFMLAHPLGDMRVSLNDYAAEWKWDGIRVQLVRAGGETRLYSRAGDDITRSFPEVAAAFAATPNANAETSDIDGYRASPYDAIPY